MSLPQTRATKSLSVCIWQERKDSNLQQMVLETTTLPIELRPYDRYAPKGEGGGWTRTSNIGGPLALPLSYSAVQRRMRKRAAVETRRRVPVTVCGPRTQHDRHQAVFLRPLFPRYHYINQFIRKHEQNTNSGKSYPQFITFFRCCQILHLRAGFLQG